MPKDRPASLMPDASHAELVAAILKGFAEESSRSFEASVDEVVRVRVGTSMNLLSVELLDHTLDPRARERLETAITSAVNLAMHRAASAAGTLFAEFEQALARSTGG